MDSIIMNNLLIFGGIFICALIFCQQYFKNQRIRGPRRIPFFGTLWRIWGKNAHEALLEDYKKYGKVFRTYTGSIPCLNIGDPKLIKAIIRDDYQHFFGRQERAVASGKTFDHSLALLPGGPKWKAIRSIISSSVGPTHVKENMQILREVTEKLVNRMKDLNKSDGKLNIQIECQCWSLEVMSKLLFSLNVDIIGNPYHEFVEHTGRELSGHVEGILSTITYLKPELARIFQGFSRSKRANGQKYLTKLFEELFREREKEINEINPEDIDRNKLTRTRRSGVDMVDNLRTNLNVDSCENSNEKTNENERAILIVAQLSASLIGFHELGTTLSRIMHCLAMNTEIQENARLEIKKGLSENNGIISYNLLRNLPYLEQCMNESMRLYPTLYRITRAVNEDKHYENIFFKAGTVIRIPTFALNRDAEYYPNPEIYDPERFNPVQLSQKDPFIFLPFGDGPRKCPAKTMVMIIMKFCLCHVLGNFKLKAHDHTIDPLQCTSGFPGSMAVRDEMWLEIETINDKNGGIQNINI